MANMFARALSLLKKPATSRTAEEQQTINAACIPLDRSPSFDNLTTEEGLSILAEMVENRISAADVVNRILRGEAAVPEKPELN